MTQLHTVHHGLGVVRPTNDVDIVLHIETTRGVPTRAATALETLGYRLKHRVDPRDNTAHRWVRDSQIVDVGASHVDNDDSHDRRDQEGQKQLLDQAGHQVDVLTADHPAPTVIERMRGRDMVPIAGGTQALKRTINVALNIRPDIATVISVPRRIRTLTARLPDDHPAWLTLDRPARANAQAALWILDRRVMQRGGV